MMLIPFAWATSGFDPAAPAANFTGVEVETLDGEHRLWSAIERLSDPDRELFSTGEYNSATEWPEAADWAPYVRECFGGARPHTSLALLHVGPSAAIAGGTPILFVPGAADNGSRGFVTMAWHFDLMGRSAYSMTFAHPHGDVFEQAEMIANAIARIRVRTGAEQVDLVAHSKGGLAAAVYLSNQAGTEWGNDAYESVGTAYRGDVRRAVFIATPLAGIDTAYRWPDGNFLALTTEDAFSPSSWDVYYPYGTGTTYTYNLAAQDFLPESGDLFPGQRQLLARQEDYPLPGDTPSLGAYSLQQDWRSTYDGGYGFYSHSDGIDAAIEAGGDVLGHLRRAGVDPGVEIFLLAGTNPLMPNGTQDYLAGQFGDVWDAGSLSTWSKFVSGLVGDGLMAVGITEEEVRGLADGDLVLGEVSGESDGLVFVSSATHASALTGRGAKVGETKTVNLSHLDLLYASPITGELLVEAATSEDAWMAAFGARYAEADTIGWVEAVLADSEDGEPEPDTGGEEDSGTVEEDSGTSEPPVAEDDGSGTARDEDPYRGGCGACDAGGGAVSAGWLLAVAVTARRRGWR